MSSCSIRLPVGIMPSWSGWESTCGSATTGAVTAPSSMVRVCVSSVFDTATACAWAARSSALSGWMVSQRAAHAAGLEHPAATSVGGSAGPHAEDVGLIGRHGPCRPPIKGSSSHCSDRRLCGAAVMIVGGLLALYVVDFDWRKLGRSGWHRSRSSGMGRPLLST